jgi:hypothetical protein
MDPRGKAKKKVNIFLEKSFPAPKRSKALGSFIGMFFFLSQRNIVGYYQKMLDLLQSQEINNRSHTTQTHNTNTKYNCILCTPIS